MGGAVSLSLFSCVFNLFQEVAELICALIQITKELLPKKYIEQSLGTGLVMENVNLKYFHCSVCFSVWYIMG